MIIEPVHLVFVIQETAG